MNAPMVPPHDLEAERALLAGCLLNPQIIRRIDLSESDFYLERHAHIYRALCTLEDRADLVTLANELRQSGIANHCDDKMEAYLADLAGMASTWAGWQYHRDIIRDKARRRDLITACHEAAHKALTGDLAETSQALSDQIQLVQSIGTTGHCDNMRLVNRVVDRAEQGARKQRGIVTGFTQLDEHLGSIEAGTTCYLAGRSSTGKTALALNIIDNVITSTEGVPVFFSLEMSGEQLMRRRTAATSGVALSRLKYGNVYPTEWPDLIQAADKLSGTPPIIVDSAEFGVVERLHAYSRGIAAKQPISVIAIDHIQLMSTKAKTYSRHDELSKVSKRLHDMSKELDVPVIVLSQLKRGTEDNERPKLSDLKESGDIENNADCVLGLWRRDRQADLMEVSCLKYRDGDVGWTGYLDFDRYTQRIRDGQAPEREPGEERKDL